MEEVHGSMMKMKLPLAWKIWRKIFVLSLLVSVAVPELEDRDRAACCTARACNKGMDKDTEDIHKLRMNQGEQGRLNPKLQMQALVSYLQLTAFLRR